MCEIDCTPCAAFLSCKILNLKENMNQRDFSNTFFCFIFHLNCKQDDKYFKEINFLISRKIIE
jgi:hypothetical protein